MTEPLRDLLIEALPDYSCVENAVMGYGYDVWLDPLKACASVHVATSDTGYKVARHDLGVVLYGDWKSIKFAIHQLLRV